MEKFQPTAIIEIQNILSIKIIERLKDDFLKRKYDSEATLADTDSEKGIYYYYDSYKNDVIAIKFEDELKEILWRITNSIKKEIDLSNSVLNNKEKVKYWQTILDSFKYIKERNIKIFELYPICFKPEETIIEYLNQKYCFNPISQFEGVSFFTLKPKYTISDLQKVYDFITGELFLDDEIYSFNEFISAFFDEKTNQTLVFNCETPIIICILDNLKLIFTDLTRKRIEESARFFTKQGVNKQSKPITVNIYQSNLKRGNKPELIRNLEKTRNFFSENFPK